MIALHPARSIPSSDKREVGSVPEGEHGKTRRGVSSVNRKYLRM